MIPFECTKCAGCCTWDNLKYYNLEEWGIEINDKGVCKNLKDDNTCGIYETRPLICRIEELYDRREEIKVVEPHAYLFLSKFKNKDEYLDFADKCCNITVDLLGLDQKYKKIEQARFSML
jgi:Fe-S-cluster containining protein|tara:strand:+ start:2738 stop:3097 length:360 start_codon:yes stop_codon:yes gene_type:complete